VVSSLVFDHLTVAVVESVILIQFVPLLLPPEQFRRVMRSPAWVGSRCMP